MNKKYLIGFVVLVIVVSIGFMLGKQSAIAPSAPVATSTPLVTGSVAPLKAPVKSGTTGAALGTPGITKNGSYLVTYTATGFSPKTLTIKLGKSVHFVNSSNKAMSLTAVDQNSQIYHELNQEQSVGRGGYYDFTFLTAGTWAYMNRNNSADRGTIIVQ